MRFHDPELGNPVFSETNEKDVAVARAKAPGVKLAVNRLHNQSKLDVWYNYLGNRRKRIS